MGMRGVTASAEDQTPNAWAAIIEKKRQVAEADAEYRASHGGLSEREFSVVAKTDGRFGGDYDAEREDTIKRYELTPDDLRSIRRVADNEQMELGMGATLGMPGPRYAKVLAEAAGEVVSPLKLSLYRYGKKLYKEGAHDLQRKGQETVGARLLDLTGNNADPETLVKRLFADAKVPYPKNTPRPIELGNSPLGPNPLAHFDPEDTQIAVYPEELALQRTQHPEEYIAGAYVHEARHAADQALYGRANVTYLPEIGGTAFKRDGFIQQGILSPDKFESWLNYYTSHPELISTLPKATQSLLKRHLRGTSPRVEDSELDEAMIKDVKKSLGNLPRDPYLAQRVKSAGHFMDYGHFETEYPRESLALEALRGGKPIDIPTDLQQSPLVQDALEQFKPRNRVQVPQEQVPQEIIPWDIPRSPGMSGVAAGVGATAPFLVEGDTPQKNPTRTPQSEGDQPEHGLGLWQLLLNQINPNIPSYNPQGN